MLLYKRSIRSRPTYDAQGGFCSQLSQFSGLVVSSQLDGGLQVRPGFTVPSNAFDIFKSDVPGLRIPDLPQQW